MFPGWEYADVAHWVVAGYLAVVTLARLVVYQRDKLVARFRAQVADERRRHAQLVLERKRQEPAGRGGDRHGDAA